LEFFFSRAYFSEVVRSLRGFVQLILWAIVCTSVTKFAIISIFLSKEEQEEEETKEKADSNARN